MDVDDETTDVTTNPAAAASPSKGGPTPRAQPAPALGGLRLASSRPPDPAIAATTSSFLATARITSVSPAVVADPAPAPPKPPPRRRASTARMSVPAAQPGPSYGGADDGPKPGPASREGATAIDLIWADPFAAPRLRRAFGDLLAREAGDDHEAAVVRVLASGEPRSVHGLAAVMAAAIGPHGGFRPPAVLVAGELRMLFDGVEALRALVSVARPFAAGDAALEEAIDAARALLSAPAVAATAEQASRLARGLRDAFEGAADRAGSAASALRALPPGFLDAQAEGLLLARRAYDRRALFGGERIRALVALPGAEAPCALYLPHALARALPMFPAFEARVVAEAHAAQDPADAHPVALDALAIGRVVSVAA